MSMTPIQLNAVVSRTHDVMSIKHNEDSKAAILQNTAHNKVEKDVRQKSEQVRQGDNTDKKRDNTDAKEKGNGQYSGDGGRRRKKSGEDITPDGIVIIKKRPSFDMKA